jgi:Protein phosphatase 2C
MAVFIIGVCFKIDSRGQSPSAKPCRSRRLGYCRMSLKCWSWIGACSTGSSHIKAGTGCQDSGACIEVPYGEDTALIAIVSDGAGTAQFSSIGSRAVVRTTARQLADFVRSASASPIISEELARQWLDDTRDRISATARWRRSPATLLPPWWLRSCFLQA